MFGVNESGLKCFYVLHMDESEVNCFMFYVFVSNAHTKPYMKAYLNVSMFYVPVHIVDSKREFIWLAQPVALLHLTALKEQAIFGRLLHQSVYVLE